jgi:hypothetical protein
MLLLGGRVNQGSSRPSICYYQRVDLVSTGMTHEGKWCTVMIPPLHDLVGKSGNSLRFAISKS